MDDVISRADVEQTVEDNILCYTHSDRPIDQDPDTECHKAIRTALRMLRKDLRKLPSAQPKTGKWIDENENPLGWHKVDKSCPAGWCKCSECGEWLIASDEYLVKGNFCPNCGAYMRGEQNE